MARAMITSAKGVSSELRPYRLRGSAESGIRRAILARGSLGRVAVEFLMSEMGEFSHTFAHFAYIVD